MELQQKSVVWSKLVNCTKNRTPGHMLNNNGLCQCSMHRASNIFSILAVNSDRFRIYRVTRSYSSRPFLCTLVLIYGNMRYQYVKTSFKIELFVGLFVSFQQRHFTKVGVSMLIMVILYCALDPRCMVINMQ